MQLTGLLYSLLRKMVAAGPAPLVQDSTKGTKEACSISRICCSYLHLFSRLCCLYIARGHFGGSGSGEQMG